MPASAKTVLIGIFVLIAVGIIFLMLLFIHPTVGDNGKTLQIRFTDVDKIDIGTRITYAGHPVGEVVSIKEIPEARTNRLSYEGDVYIYEVKAKVDSSVDVFNSDEITVRTSGLLGEKSIEINPQPPQKDQPLFKIENQILYSVPVGSVESTLKSFAKLTTKIYDTLSKIETTIEEIQQEKIVEGVAEITQHLISITQILNQPEKWNKTFDGLNELVTKANHSWIKVDQIFQDGQQISQAIKKSWPKVENTIDQFHLAATSAKETAELTKELVSQVQKGEGSLGQLLTNKDLYFQLKAVVHQGSHLMSDLNRFGLLFQTNKKWQRLEGQRRKLLQKLSDPSYFSQYFNQEMQQISTSLSAVSMLLKQSGPVDPYSLYFDPEFMTQFYGLMKNVAEMEETVQLYNQQLVSQE